MKRKIVWGLFLVVLMTSVATINAQGTYTVQAGDTGWELARTYYDDPVEWRAIVKLNPFLQQLGRVFETTNPDTGEKKIILLLKPGEVLEGLARLGVDPPVAIPITQLVESVPAKADTAVVETPNSGDGWSWWMWVLLAAIVALATYGAWLQYSNTRRRAIREREERERRETQEARERELRRDPITSGPPMVPGGIPATDAPRLTNFFDQQAVNRYAERNPTIDRSTIRATRVGPIEEGTIVGEGEVGYLGGDFRPRRIEQPLAAYRARYRFQDGTEEDLMTLQACMNPVNYGGDTYRGFTFTPRTTAVPTPEPERPGPEPMPHPAIVARSIRTAAQAEGQNTITIGDEVMVFPLGYHVSVDRTTNAITLEANAVRMTLAVKPQAQVGAAPATGTGE